MSIMIKDPNRIAEYKMAGLSNQYELIRYIMYHTDMRTIPEVESNRMIELVNSPDIENMELVKVLLQQKYKLL